MTILEDDGILKVDVIYEKQMTFHINKTTPNTSLNHKKFIILPLLHREIEVERTHFQSPKTQEIKFLKEVTIRISEESMTYHIKNRNEHNYQSKKFSSFYVRPPNYLMSKKLIFTLPKCKK
jgi:hypothetical protein